MTTGAGMAPELMMWPRRRAPRRHRRFTYAKLLFVISPSVAITLLPCVHIDHVTSWPTLKLPTGRDVWDLEYVYYFLS